MGRFVVAAMIGLLLAVAPAQAAEPWSPPQTVSSAAGQIPDSSIEIDAQGFTRLAWISQEPIPDHRNHYPASWLLAMREPGAYEFGPEQADDWNYLDPVTYGRDRMLALSRRFLEDGNQSVLYARFGNTRGKLDFTQDIARLGYSSPDENAVGPALAVYRDAVAAWVEEDRSNPQVVHAYASVRRLGGRFGEPVKLARRRHVKSLVAGSGPGVVFVAWERGDVVEARVKRRGRRWGPVQRVGVTYSDLPRSSFEVAFSGRRAYLAWVAPGAGEYTLRVAVLPGGRTRFRRAQRVDVVLQELKRFARPIALVPLPGHGALLGWTGWDGKRVRAWTARTGRGARFGRRVSVAPPGEPAVLGDVAVAPTGVLAVWTRLDDRELGDRVRAAFRRPGGSFGPPEDVSDLDRAGLAVDAAFDPVARRWTVVWPQLLGPPVYDWIAATHLRAATRPG